MVLCLGSSGWYCRPAVVRIEPTRGRAFGGACVLRAFKGGASHLGQKNVEVAQQILIDEGIPVAAQDVEGERGRKLIFQTHDGAAWVRSL